MKRIKQHIISLGYTGKCCLEKQSNIYTHTYISFHFLSAVKDLRQFAYKEKSFVLALVLDVPNQDQIAQNNDNAPHWEHLVKPTLYRQLESKERKDTSHGHSPTPLHPWGSHFQHVTFRGALCISNGTARHWTQDPTHAKYTIYPWSPPTQPVLGKQQNL